MSTSPPSLSHVPLTRTPSLPLPLGFVSYRCRDTRTRTHAHTRSPLGKVAVVSIAGPYRTGKSYFLNYFANQVVARSSDPPRVAGEFSFDLPFKTSPTVDVWNAGDGGGGGETAGEVVYHLLPACANPLPEQPDTALLLVDAPGLMDPRR